MTELFYDINSGLIALVLFISMVVATEMGYRLGLSKASVTNDSARDHIKGIQSSILGILALLLGFTFSLALQRFDSRSAAVVDEANAIGTAWLRTQLLPPSLRSDTQAMMREYTDARVQANALTQIDQTALNALQVKATTLQNTIWQQAVQASERDPVSRAPALFLQSVNDFIDSFGRRDAALNLHVPEVVLLLLYATFLMAGAIVGYASGVASHRPSLVSYIMVALIVVLVFIILDLDRPRRGLILVSQKSLTDLQASMRADPRVAGQVPLTAISPQGASSASR